MLEDVDAGRVAQRHETARRRANRRRRDALASLLLSSQEAHAGHHEPSPARARLSQVSGST